MRCSNLFALGFTAATGVFAGRMSDVAMSLNPINESAVLSAVSFARGGCTAAFCSQCMVRVAGGSSAAVGPIVLHFRRGR